jgi:hypothetical protein
MEPIPRYTKEFVGLGHTLELRKKERRKIELEERAIANRVLFLEKEERRAKKSFEKKREELGRIVGVVQRQTEEQLLKEQVVSERQRQVELAHQENKLRRLLHAQMQTQNQQQAQRRNSLDYERTRRLIEQGERRKEMQLQQDLLQRRVSLRLSRSKLARSSSSASRAAPGSTATSTPATTSTPSSTRRRYAGRRQSAGRN